MSPAVAEGAHLGPYEVVELLGRGGMGEVYRARDPRLGRDVAIKVLPIEVASDGHRLGRFEREARAVAALSHPNILTVFDVGSTDGIAYLVTELLAGPTLREKMLGAAPSVKRALSLTLQVARGLEAAHAKGIVHRDIKPENLLVVDDGRVKILDFGLAKLVGGRATTTGDTAGSEPTRPGELRGTLSYMSPEQARGLPVDARTDVFSLGVVLHELLSGEHPFRRDTAAATLEAILQEEVEDLSRSAHGVSPALSAVVQRCLSKDREDRYPSAHELAVALEALLGTPSGSEAPEPSAERGPYPGLESFTERDAAVFFGRDAEVAALWAKLRTRKLLAVFGASGAGKTSFVRAGVVARRPEGWGAIVVRPGAAPPTNLARALAPAVAGDPDAVQRLLRFDDPRVVVEAFERWRRGYREALLVVDQFEELFTQHPPEVQVAYAALLGRLAEEADLHVLLSLRDDFLIRCGEQRALAPVFESLTPLLPLDPDALCRVIVEPARSRGVALQDANLVHEMVSAVEGERAALPVLAFAVSRLWEHRDRERHLLTREAYEAMGGVEGALARHAEATLERVGPDRQRLVRDILRNLVTAQGTRAVADREELLSAFPDREAAEDVLGQLVDARLVTSYEAEGLDGGGTQDRIEIVHESLLRSWPRLVRWQAQDADGTVLRDQLRQAAHLWEDMGRTPDLLWSGTPYREFELWRERYPGTLTRLEVEYARAMVERARRRTRLRRAAVAAGFALLGGVAAAIALSREQTAAARDRARLEARRAEASQLLAMAQARLEADPTEALALTTASLEIQDSPAARIFALRAIAEAPPAFETESGPTMRVPAFSRDGSMLAVAGHSEEALVWSRRGELIARLPGNEVTPQGGNRVAWGPGGLLLVGPGFDLRPGEVRVWSFPEGRLLSTIQLRPAGYWGVGAEDVFVELRSEEEQGRGMLSLRSWRLPEGPMRELGDVDETALGSSSSFFEPHGRGWLYTRGRRVHWRSLPLGREKDRVFSEYEADVHLVALPEDLAGHGLAFRDVAGELRVWLFDEEGRAIPQVVRKPGTAPLRVYPESSGRWLANDAASDAEGRLWNRAAWPAARPLRLRRQGSWYGAVSAFAPGGDWVVESTQAMSRLTLWPLPERQPNVVDGYSGLLRPLAFSPDSRWLVTSWSDRTLRLWDVRDGGLRTLAIPEDDVLWRDFAFEARSRFLFAVGLSGAYVIPLDRSPPRRLEGFSEDTLLEGAAVSPSGRLVATAFAYGKGSRTLRVWDLETGDQTLLDLPESSSRGSRTGYEQGVFDLSFAGESTLYTAGDGGVRVWHLETGTQEVVYELEPGRSARMAMARAGPTVLIKELTMRDLSACRPATAIDVRNGVSHSLPGFGACASNVALALGPGGRIAGVGDMNGIIRVGDLSGREPYLLLGHDGPVNGLAISPDLRWVASTGEDDTLRLWPMPDLSRPPRHTLPHDELIARLKSLTNLRAVRDPEATGGWRVELAPFPGWEKVPTW